VFFQVFNLLNVRGDLRSVFSRATLDNHTAFTATAAVIVLLVLVVELDVLHTFFTTTGLTSAPWLTRAAIGSTVSWVGELVKIVLRTRALRRPG
jgi:Ca2+-transporting ATPase